MWYLSIISFDFKVVRRGGRQKTAKVPYTPPSTPVKKSGENKTGKSDKTDKSEKTDKTENMKRKDNSVRDDRVSIKQIKYVHIICNVY